MNQLLHISLRKANTLRLTLARCANWPSIIRAKTGMDKKLDALVFRDGFRLKIMQPLKQTWGEVFEPAIADVYGIAECEPDLIVDVGANIGAFACRAAFLRPRAAVHAFEPSLEHVTLLRENIAQNELENVRVYDTAVTKDGRDVIFSQLGAGGSSGLFLHEGGNSTQIKSTSLACIDFSQSRFLFIKLDCEGAEGEIIEWICENLAKLPPRISIASEYHHWCPVPRDQILAGLNACGFVAQGRSLFDESYIFASKNT